MLWLCSLQSPVQAAYLISTFVDVGGDCLLAWVQAAYLISTFVDEDIPGRGVGGLGSLFNFYFCRSLRGHTGRDVQAAYLISTFVDVSISVSLPGVQAAYLISTFVDVVLMLILLAFRQPI